MVHKIQQQDIQREHIIQLQGFTSGTHNTAVGLIYIKLVIAMGFSLTSGDYNTAIGNTSGD